MFSQNTYRFLDELAKPAAVNGEVGEATENPYANETCEKCGKPMILKKGRFGQFLACTGYPECKTTRKITKAGVAVAPVMLEERCPVCDSRGAGAARSAGVWSVGYLCGAEARDGTKVLA